MAEIYVKEQVSIYREKFYEAFRDKAGELHHHIPDVEKIETIERHDIDENTVKLVNHWKASASKIPKALRMLVNPDKLTWKEHVTYNKNEWVAKWSIEPDMVSYAVSCEGKITFEDKGNNLTEVVITGDLKIDASKIPGVPKIGSGTISRKAENFAIPMISPNLSAYILAVKTYLENQ